MKFGRKIGFIIIFPDNSNILQPLPENWLLFMKRPIKIQLPSFFQPAFVLISGKYFPFLLEFARIVYPFLS